MQEISIKEFLKINKKDLQIIDVRERYEYENGNIESINIPMDEILKLDWITKSNLKYIIYYSII